MILSLTQLTVKLIVHGSFHVLCSVGSVLSDGDIGPTHSVDVSDPDQVHRFFVWNRVNGTVALQFQRNNAFSRFNVSYIDIYTLSAPSARIRLTWNN